jgi:glutamine cyclotransferase
MRMTLTPYLEDTILSNRSIAIWENVTSEHIRNHLLLWNSNSSWMNDLKINISINLTVETNAVHQYLLPAVVERRRANEQSLALDFTLEILQVQVMSEVDSSDATGSRIDWNAFILDAWGTRAGMGILIPMDRDDYIYNLQNYEASNDFVDIRDAKVITLGAFNITNRPSVEPSSTTSPTIEPSNKPTLLSTFDASNRPTESPTSTGTGTITSTRQPTSLSSNNQTTTRMPTEAPLPNVISNKPSTVPTSHSPTSHSTQTPTQIPSSTPTSFATGTLTADPTQPQTQHVSASPTRRAVFPSPTTKPTTPATANPTTLPTPLSTSSPTRRPVTSLPTERASPLPTDLPTPPSTPGGLPMTVLGSFELLETVPHDDNAFTQGLELVSNQPALYFESTGLYGQSSVRIVDLQSGQVLQQQNLASGYFGEGMTYFNGRLVQITWKEQTGFVYNATNVEVLNEFSYETTNGEGWGICFVESQNIFYVSDGTDHLHTWDANNFALVDKVPVTMRISALAAEQSVRRINELEWDPFTQTVLANVWQQNYIVRITPSTGFVTHRYNLQSLARPANAGVLNGIARTGTPNEFWATGKLWPYMYRIRLID